MTDRRVDARVPAETWLTRATVRGGSVVVVIDFSAGGALVQGPKPLPPGSRVHLHVTTEHGKVSLAAHVLRCAVWALDPEAGVTYRGALKFDHRCDVRWEHGGDHGAAMPAVKDPQRPTDPHHRHHHHHATERPHHHAPPHPTPRGDDRGLLRRSVKGHGHT